MEGQHDHRNRASPGARLTVREAPTDCPNWCEPAAHSAEYEADFHDFEDRADYEEALALFRVHKRHIAYRHLSGLTEERGEYEVEVVAADPHAPGIDFRVATRADDGRLRGVELNLSAGEARSLAAQLVRAADLLDFDGLER